MAAEYHGNSTVQYLTTQTLRAAAENQIYSFLSTHSGGPASAACGTVADLWLTVGHCPALCLNNTLMLNEYDQSF